jgi:hypothetical protein
MTGVEMKGFIIGLIIGAIVGGGGAFYFLSSATRRANAPGVPIKPPDAAGPQPGTAEIVLRQELFDQVLDAVFRDMNAPSFPLTNGGSSGCENRITILSEGSGVKTRLSFDNNKIAAPLAFSGSYPSMVGCMQFTGWAQAALDLRFEPETQSVIGQVNVATVDLDGVNPFFTALMTPVVQSTLNERVNPIRIIDGRQLAVDLPIEATAGKLQGKPLDVRAEVKDNALHLYVTEQFSGTK